MGILLWERLRSGTVPSSRGIRKRFPQLLELLDEELAHLTRVGLPLCLPHDPTHQEVDRLLVTAAIRGDRIRVLSENLVDRRVDDALVWDAAMREIVEDAIDDAEADAE